MCCPVNAFVYREKCFRSFTGSKQWRELNTHMKERQHWVTEKALYSAKAGTACSVSQAIRTWMLRHPPSGREKTEGWRGKGKGQTLCDRVLSRAGLGLRSLEPWTHCLSNTPGCPQNVLFQWQAISWFYHFDSVLAWSVSPRSKQINTLKPHL